MVVEWLIIASRISIFQWKEQPRLLHCFKLPYSWQKACVAIIASLTFLLLRDVSHLSYSWIILNLSLYTLTMQCFLMTTRSGVPVCKTNLSLKLLQDHQNIEIAPVKNNEIFKLKKIKFIYMYVFHFFLIISFLSSTLV